MLCSLQGLPEVFVLFTHYLLMLNNAICLVYHLYVAPFMAICGFNCYFNDFKLACQCFHALVLHAEYQSYNLKIVFNISVEQAV